ncbi:MAG: hypothetical protein ACXVQJ_09620, partial [Actinomycetota bacterium]
MALHAHRRRFLAAFLALPFLIAAAACSSSSSATAADGSASCTPSDSPTITFLAYSTPQAVYDEKIIPAFKSMWKDQHNGQIVNFLES